jgi:hypothetical protein
MKTLCAGELCYLTDDAQEGLRVLQDAGIEDLDLALAVLERLWPDVQIYSLPEEEPGHDLDD